MLKMKIKKKKKDEDVKDGAVVSDGDSKDILNRDSKINDCVVFIKNKDISLIHIPNNDANSSKSNSNMIKTIDDPSDFINVDKVINSEDSISNNENSPKKRGRKKKIVPDISAGNQRITDHINKKSSSNILDSILSKLEEKKREQFLRTNNDDLNSSAQGSSGNIKRKRGRPRKSSIIYGNLNQHNAPNKWGGNFEEKSVEFPVKKVKYDNLSECSNSSMSQLNSSVQKPRGRGRPRKSDVLNTSEVTNSSRSKDKPISSLGSSYKKISSFRRKICKPKRYQSFEDVDSINDDDENYDRVNSTSEQVDDSDSSKLHDDNENDNELHNDNGDVCSTRGERHLGDDENQNENKEFKKPERRKGRKKIIQKLVKCGVCGEQMLANEFTKKHIDTHNFICWIEGDPPIDPTSEADIKSLYMKLKKQRKHLFVGLKCEKCGVRKKSGVGYVSHIKQCGMTSSEREALKVPCQFCYRVMLPCSLKVHIQSEHKTIDQVEEANCQNDSLIVNGYNDNLPRKRQAAKKAEHNIEKFIMDDNYGSVKNQKKLYRITNGRVQPSFYRKWKEAIKESGIGKCFIPDCTFTADDLRTLAKHYNQCPKNNKDYVCKVCGIKMKTEDEIKTHVQNEHKHFVVGDSEFNVQDKDCLESGNRNNSGGFKPIYDRPYFVKANRMYPLAFLKNCLYKTYHYHRKYAFMKALFKGCFPTKPDLLKQSEAELYLPTAVESINYSSDGLLFNKLGRFKSTNFNGTKLLFTGGPVWALSWCPVPMNVSSQYLAVACHPDLNSMHKITTVYNYNNLIQIWDCGILNNFENNDHEAIPKLMLGIASSNGAIWSLEWCPKGCYQPEENRLGLLAAAFSSGMVLVYSVPLTPVINEGLPIVKLKPALQLELTYSESGHCTRVAWPKHNPFNILACGYSDGTVAIFDLNSFSPLLRLGNKLKPYLVFQAHLKFITGLEFLPVECNNYIITASSDRDIKFWNLQDICGPVSVSQLYRTITVTDIAWFNHWMCAVGIYDDALAYNLINVTLNAYRDFILGQPYPTMTQNSLNWSISANDWTNAFVTSTDSGEVTVMHLRQMYAIDEKAYKRFKRHLTTTDLCKLDGQENEDDRIKKMKGPSSYEEANEQYGLILKTISYPEQPSSKRESFERNLYPIKSINKVVWNKHQKSFLYVAAGYHAGFVQILKDTTIDRNKSIISGVLGETITEEELIQEEEYLL